MGRVLVVSIRFNGGNQGQTKMNAGRNLLSCPSELFTGVAQQLAWAHCLGIVLEIVLLFSSHWLSNAWLVAKWDIALPAQSRIGEVMPVCPWPAPAAISTRDSLRFRPTHRQNGRGRTARQVACHLSWKVRPSPAITLDRGDYTPRPDDSTRRLYHFCDFAGHKAPHSRTYRLFSRTRAGWPPGWTPCPPHHSAPGCTGRRHSCSLRQHWTDPWPGHSCNWFQPPWNPLPSGRSRQSRSEPGDWRGRTGGRGQGWTWPARHCLAADIEYPNPGESGLPPWGRGPLHAGSNSGQRKWSRSHSLAARRALPLRSMYVYPFPVYTMA